MLKRNIYKITNAMRTLICMVMLSGILRNHAAAQDTLTELQLNNYVQQVKNTIMDLGGHIAHIADKSISISIRKGYIETALQLFADPDKNTVEITSFLNERNKKIESIRTYLNNLMNLRYRHVKVTWYTVDFSFLKDDNGNYIQGPNGSYYGAGVFTQSFEGDYDFEKKANRDIIKKRINAVLIFVRPEKPYVRPFWDLKLGDIRVIDIVE